MGGEPIAEGLFTWPNEEPRLLGGHCGPCGALSFPMRDGCPKCGSTEVTSRELGRTGTLWAWTSQGFPPKEPFNGNLSIGADSVPWYVGLVEIPGELRVETLLTGVTEAELEIGMPMRLVVLPFRTDENGNETVTFAFTPDDTNASATKEAAAHA